ncbi:MAG: Ni/Fe hydrogenase subunit alpha [Verrucomicrobiia bacterium]
MSTKLTIDPVSRIEGHAKITIQLNDDGNVASAHFHVTEFRGFEEFCKGRPLWEMPGITSRICGICPISHMLASAKAGDQILSVQIPEPALKLRKIMNLAQFIQSHALSFFYLSSPDLLYGFDAPDEQRNIFYIIKNNPDLAKDGIELRKFGQTIIQMLGGARIHPSWAVPGGVRSYFSNEEIKDIQQMLPRAKQIAINALDLFKKLEGKFSKEIPFFGNFPTLFLGLVNKDGSWEHHDGVLRICDSDGNVIMDDLDAQSYQEFIAEAVKPDSYLKLPYFKPAGIKDGIYRVGPLARLNICSKIGTPLADAELAEFRQRGNGAVNSSFYYHYTRLIEILACIEKIEYSLEDPDLTSTRLKADAGINKREGVGVSEAPRGTLFHHYKVDQHGLIEYVNLIIATGQNNLAMEKTVSQLAKHFIKDGKISNSIFNRIEAGIRAYDPCLSCSTHMIGTLASQIEILDAKGNKIATNV